MAKEDKRKGSCLANDNGSPDDVSLDPRILRIACATPKEDCKVRDIFPAFVHGGIHGAEPLPQVLRDNSIAKSESPFDRRGEHDPKPARMRATAEDKRVVEDRPTRDYLEATRAFWQPYAERELTVKMPAKWPATSLAFSQCCASGHSENGSVQNAEPLRQFRHPQGGSVEDYARVRRQKIKCSLDAELICSLAQGLIQCATAARGRT
jgi:hypothetical protein